MSVLMSTESVFVNLPGRHIGKANIFECATTSFGVCCVATMLQTHVELATLSQILTACEMLTTL